MVLTAVIGFLASVFANTFGIYGWIAAGVIVLALAPIVARVEYRITGKEYRRAKKP
jgi:hypothetical protein